MTNQRLIALCCFSAVALTATTALAQSGPARVQNNQVVPSPDGVFTIDGSDVSESLDFSGGLVLDYTDDSLELDREGSQAAIEDQLTGDAIFAIGLLDAVELGVGLPINFDTTGTTADGQSFDDSAEIGDLRLRPKVSILDRNEYNVGLAAYTQLGVPTGQESSLTSTGDFYAEPGLIVDVQQGRFKVAVNAGAKLQEEQDFAGATDSVGSQLTYGVGGEVAILPNQLAIGGEIYGATDITAPFDSTEDTPIEGLAGVKYMEQNTGLEFEVAGGGGIISDRNTSDYRVMGGITYSFGNSDYDNDGIAARNDDCPTVAEDMDGYKDHDGCLDSDNDGDSIADAYDVCPDKAEDIDGWDDNDGCPELDNDFDGVTDTSDSCPNAYGLDGEGCPELAQKDDDDAPVIINNYVEIPEQSKEMVFVEDKEIKLVGRVYFDTAKSTLKPRSKPLLNQVAATLKANPEIKLVQVRGYADERGTDGYNYNLSLNRARTVKNYLVQQGVSGQRLMVAGMGETRPALQTDDTVDEETLKRMEANRRVQFKVMEISASR